ncbi:Ribonuclease H-like superfamily [Sesbania bispinosa]|nr:Ribonuclease H-like superfamily [Sesbania bispinosa]
MVLDITIEAMDDNPSYNTYRYNTYTVHADDHRILTVVTFSDQILSKWLQDLVKSTKNNRDSLLVAVTAECRSIEYTKRGLMNCPYDIITLCVASHCIIYHLPEERNATPKSLCDFFDNPRVVAVGMEMETMARKLERDHDIKMKNAVDLCVA